MFDYLQNFFEHLATEHKRLKYFIEKGTLILPVSHTIAYHDDHRDENHEKEIIKKVPITVQYVPLAHVFTKLFLQPNLFTETCNYMNFLDNSSDIIFNIIQAP